MAKAAYIGINCVKNMIPNGVFNSADGWTTNHSSYVSITGGCVQGKGTSTSGIRKWINTTDLLSLTANHKYYCCVMYQKSGGGDTGWGMYNTSANVLSWLDGVSINASSWTKLSKIYTPTANTTTNFLLYGPYDTWASDLSVKWDNLFVIDLTALYGAGKEPTQAECDNIFSIGSDNYVYGNITNNIARKVKKMYIGIDGVARKVKKAYIGVAGIARLFFRDGKELKYLKRADDLRVVTHGGSAAANANYAIFAGGWNSANSTQTSNVDAYNTSGTRTSCTNLIEAKSFMAAGTIGGSAVFAGGDSSSGVQSTVNAYNNSLTRSSPTSLPSPAAFSGAASTNNYFLIGGGCKDSAYTMIGTVTAYNSSFTRSAATALSVSRRWVIGTSNGNHAIFAGGANKSDTTYNTVDCYNSSLTKQTVTALSANRGKGAGASVGGNMLIGGGYTNSSWNSSDVFDIYDSSLTRSSRTSSWTGYETAAASGDGIAAFVGGQRGGNASWTMLKTVLSFDESLTMTYHQDLPVGLKLHSATFLGDKLFVGGGSDNSVMRKEVYMYEAS